jgi:hypothetical protein
MAGDPRQAIIEHLGEPMGPRSVVDSGRPLQSPVASVGVGNPFAADLTTVQFIKERWIPGRWLYALSFEDLNGHTWFWLAAAEPDEAGQWTGFGVAGGSGQSPPRSSPWLNLAGCWGRDQFYAGGRVEAAGAHVGQVRLTLGDGAVLTDDALAGVALFLARHPDEPAFVDLYAIDGRHLSRHSAF